MDAPQWSTQRYGSLGSTNVVEEPKVTNDDRHFQEKKKETTEVRDEIDEFWFPFQPHQQSITVLQAANKQHILLL